MDSGPSTEEAVVGQADNDQSHGVGATAKVASESQNDKECSTLDDQQAIDDAEDGTLTCKMKARILQIEQEMVDSVFESSSFDSEDGGDDFDEEAFNQRFICGEFNDWDLETSPQDSPFTRKIKKKLRQIYQEMEEDVLKALEEFAEKWEERIEEEKKEEEVPFLEDGQHISDVEEEDDEYVFDYLEEHDLRIAYIQGKFDNWNFQNKSRR